MLTLRMSKSCTEDSKALLIQVLRFVASFNREFIKHELVQMDNCCSSIPHSPFCWPK
jgi:hypothetical protein